MLAEEVMTLHVQWRLGGCEISLRAELILLRTWLEIMIRDRHKRPRLRLCLKRLAALPSQSDGDLSTMRVELIGHFKLCMTDVYLHI